MPVGSVGNIDAISTVQRETPAALEKQVKVSWATQKGKSPKFVALSNKVRKQIREGKFHHIRLNTRVLADAPSYQALVPKDNPSQFIVMRSGGFGMMPAVMSQKAIDIVSGPVVELNGTKAKVTMQERDTLSLLLPADPVRPTEMTEWTAQSNSRIIGAPEQTGTLPTARVGVTGNPIFQTTAMGITELGKPAKIKLSRSGPDGRKQTITVEITVRPIRMF